LTLTVLNRADDGDDGFAVEQERAGRQCAHRFDRQRKPQREIIAVAGERAVRASVKVAPQPALARLPKSHGWRRKREGAGAI
jgi:hypothetical protein